jgi:hypothetical protein
MGFDAFCVQGFSHSYAKIVVEKVLRKAILALLYSLLILPYMSLLLLKYRSGNSTGLHLHFMHLIKTKSDANLSIAIRGYQNHYSL